MIMKRLRNAGKPRKRPWVSGCEVQQPPVQHSRHVCCRVEFAIDRRYVQMKEWVLTGLRRQGEQMCPQGRPGRFVGEVGHDLVSAAVEHLNVLGSEELLGRHLKAIAVTLDGVTQPGSRAAQISQHGGG